MNSEKVRDVLINIAKGSVKVRKRLGEEGKKNIEFPGQDKRTCLLEQRIYEETKDILNKDVVSYSLKTEGFPDYGNYKPNIIIFSDPVDNTVCYVRQNSISPFPVTSVISAFENKPDVKYKDVLAAAIVDLNSGEIWSASSETQTCSSAKGAINVDFKQEHDAVEQSDFYFKENAELRMKLTNPKNSEWDRFECLNAGSIAWQAAKVACGEADALFNVVGPKGLELSAMYLIVKQAKGYTISPNNGIEIGNEKIKFEERVPVIMARSRDLAQKIYNDFKK